MPTVQQKLQLMQSQRVEQLLNHIYDQKGTRQPLNILLKGSMARIWELSVAREIDRLAKGIFNIKGNDAIEFIQKSEVPHNETVTYVNMVYDSRLLKSNQYRVRLTVGGDRLEYYNDTATPATYLI